LVGNDSDIEGDTSASLVFAQGEINSGIGGAEVGVADLLVEDLLDGRAVHLKERKEGRERMKKRKKEGLREREEKKDERRHAHRERTERKPE
jgi:hypothetical protein